jgi:hypothetical protein
MSQKKWICSNTYADSFEQLNKFTGELVSLMKQLKNGNHLELYFFNRYTNPKKNEYYIKFGLVNGNEKALTELDNLLNKHKVRKEQYECDLREVDGLPIDFIKCMSCELFEKIRELTKGKPLTMNQLGYLLHFLMNQISLGYENELALYKSLEQSIKQQLKKSSQNTKTKS